MGRRGERTLIAAAVALVLVAGALTWLVTRGGHDHEAEHGHQALPFPAVSVRSVADGDWSSPGTWSTGRVPVRTDDVLVQHDVAFDLPSTEVQTLRVANGSLVFPTEGRTSITLDGILVADQGGTIRAGSVEHPVMGTVAIRFRVADETRFVGGPDFQPTDTGLWVMD